MSEKIVKKKKIENVKLDKVFYMLARDGVRVSKMILRVESDGSVSVDVCEYEEEETS